MGKVMTLELNCSRSNWSILTELGFCVNVRKNGCLHIYIYIYKKQKEKIWLIIYKDSQRLICQVLSSLHLISSHNVIFICVFLLSLERFLMLLTQYRDCVNVTYHARVGDDHALALLSIFLPLQLLPLKHICNLLFRNQRCATV